MVRFFVNFSFSALMNIRTHGVQAVQNLDSSGRDARGIIAKSAILTERRLAVGFGHPQTPASSGERVR
jgi:hypothetical protein